MSTISFELVFGPVLNEFRYSGPHREKSSTRAEGSAEARAERLFAIDKVRTSSPGHAEASSFRNGW